MKSSSAAMLATLLVLAGLLTPACNRIAPVSSPPAARHRATFWVAVDAPDMPARQMQRQCVEQIEAEIAAIPEVTRIVSNITDGRAEMAIRARASTARRIFRQKLRIALDDISPRLPQGAAEPRLLTHDPLGTLMRAAPAPDFQAGQVKVYLDAEKLKELGLTRAAVLDQVGQAQSERPEDATLRQFVTDLPVRVDDRTTVPLGEIAEIRTDPQPGAIIRVWPSDS